MRGRSAKMTRSKELAVTASAAQTSTKAERAQEVADQWQRRWRTDRQVQLVEVCEICKDYSHSTYDCPYYLKYEKHHYYGYALPQPDFIELMPSPQIPQHEKRWTLGSETMEELEVFQTEPEIIIAQDEEEENEMIIEVISERQEEPQKESKED
ncbi:hypothetical protein Scep_019922 [Stephania cephalantha]|uniref:Uncharacterized protein n=1 Tax=Stephania cephalantha TaxID=152367 RepID=A0AAP0NMM8_9MAGN